MIALAIHLTARALLSAPSLSLSLVEALWEAARASASPRDEVQPVVNALLRQQPLSTLDLQGDAAVRAIDLQLAALGALPAPESRPTVPVGPPPSYPDLVAAAQGRLIDTDAVLADRRAA